MDDSAEFVRRAREGDAAAVGVLLAHSAPSIFRFARRMCGDVHDAEDVVQDTLITISEHFGAFEGRSSYSSWVFALTRSACGRRRRGKRNAPALREDVLADFADSAPSPEDSAAFGEVADALARGLRSLSSEHRDVIQLRDIEGLSAPDAAEILGISVDALKSRLHRARVALRFALLPVLPVLESVGDRDDATAGCADILSMWSRKLEGDLRRSDCRAMEAHLAECGECRAACDALKDALLACRQARAEAVPRSVHAAIKRAMASWRNSSGAAV